MEGSYRVAGDNVRGRFHLISGVGPTSTVLEPGVTGSTPLFSGLLPPETMAPRGARSVKSDAAVSVNCCTQANNLVDY